MSSPHKKLNDYQRAVRDRKVEIAHLAAEKGVNFMKAASLLLKKHKSPNKNRDSCKKSGRVYVKAHKSADGKNVKRNCRKSPKAVRSVKSPKAQKSPKAVKAVKAPKAPKSPKH